MEELKELRKMKKKLRAMRRNLEDIETMVREERAETREVREIRKGMEVSRGEGGMCKEETSRKMKVEKSRRKAEIVKENG